MPAAVLAFDNVTKTYATNGRQIHALRPTTFSLAEGESVAVMGRSGSGKSTLVHLAATVDVPTSGEVHILGRPVHRMSDRARTELRRHDIGLIFQFFHLLPHLTVRENVSLPGVIAGDSPRDSRSRVDYLLDKVGLSHRGGDLAARLSGGEMQRVAVCRALLRRPTLLLADEPTGNLDDENGKMVMDLLLALAAEEHSALLVVTHSRELAARAGTNWSLQDGNLSPA